MKASPYTNWNSLMLLNEVRVKSCSKKNKKIVIFLKKTTGTMNCD